MVNQSAHVQMREDFILLQEHGDIKTCERLYQLLIQKLPVLSDNDLVNDLERVNPQEVLLPKGLAGKGPAAVAAGLFPGRVNHIDDWSFDPDNGRQRLIDHFGVGSLEGFGIDGMDAGVAAGGDGPAFEAVAAKDGDLADNLLPSPIRLARRRLFNGLDRHIVPGLDDANLIHIGAIIEIDRPIVHRTAARTSFIV